MANLAIRQATYEDVLRATEHQVAEILNGELHTQPRLAPRHAVAGSNLGGHFSGPFHRGRGGPGGWWIIDEPELHLGPHIMVPDIAGWRRERMSEYPDAPWFDLAPDWACEILSPSTMRKDRLIKMPLYAEHGVRWFWLIDPLLKSLEAFELVDGRYSLHAILKDDDPVRLAPFDAIEFPLKVPISVQHYTSLLQVLR